MPARLRRGRALDGLDREIRDHIDREVEEHIARGLSPEKARRRALLAFGSVARVREDVRAVWVWIWLEQVLQDARCAVRTLRKTPGLSVVALLCLGTAIGLATAAFAVIDGVFLSRLPVPHADRLVVVHEYHLAGRYNVPLTAAEFTLRRDRSQSFDALGAWYSRNATLRAGDAEDPVAGMVRAAHMSPGSLDMLGVAPLLGRHAREDDVAPGAIPVVILGHDVWRTRFGSDAGVLTRTVEIAGTLHRVIGVMPPGFAFPAGDAAWIPVQTNSHAANVTHEGLTLFGRLAAGVSAPDAAAELAVLTSPAGGRDAADATVPLVRPFTRGFMSPEHEWAMYGLLTGLVLFLVVIAANLGNLFLARNSVRTREIALRGVLGAGRGRLVRLLLLESLSLGFGGLLLGLAVSRAALIWFQSRVTDLPWWADFTLNPLVVTAAAACALVGSAVAGVGPALRLTRGSGSQRLKEESAMSSGLRFSRAGTEPCRALAPGGSRGADAGRRRGRLRSAIAPSAVD
jgi:putative ABC transport system permease protein